MQVDHYELLLCHAMDGSVPLEEWIGSLDVATRGRVRIRIDRLEDGNFGDAKSAGGGVLELRLDLVPGTESTSVFVDGRFTLSQAAQRVRRRKTFFQLNPFGGIMNKTSSYKQSLLESLADPDEAVAYLNAGLEDSVGAFLKALRNVAQAQQMSHVAKAAGIQRESLYRALSDEGNPTIETLTGILAALHLKIHIVGESAEQPRVLAEEERGRALARG